jgi:hypothetical protein
MPCRVESNTSELIFKNFSPGSSSVGPNNTPLEQIRNLWSIPLVVLVMTLGLVDSEFDTLVHEHLLLVG